MRHDLETGDDRTGEVIDLRRNGLQPEQPVDTEANGQPGLGRFDVYVARLLIDGFHQQFVHQTDDRRCLGFPGRFADFVGDILQQFNFVFLATGDQLIDGVAADAEVLLDQPDDIVPQGECRPQREAAECGEFVERFQVKRIADSNDRVAVLPFEWQDGMPEDGRGGKPRDQFGIDGKIRQVHVVAIEFVGQGAKDGFAGG